MVTYNLESVASVQSTAAIPRGRFVTATASAQSGVLAGTLSALNGKALGVSLEAAAASGEWIPLQTRGIAVLEANESLAAGDDVGAIANGYVGKTSVTNVLGVALEPASAGQYCRVKLIK